MANEQCQVKAGGGTHQIAVKNVKQTFGPSVLWRAQSMSRAPVELAWGLGRTVCPPGSGTPLLPGPLSLLGGMRRKMLWNILPHYESDLNLSHSWLFKYFQCRQCFVLFFSWGIRLE